MRAVHPGEILRDELNELGLSARLFAHYLHIPTNRVTAILNGQRSVTADTAIRMATYFRSTPNFWLNLQTAYDLKITMQKAGEQIKQEIQERATA